MLKNVDPAKRHLTISGRREKMANDSGSKKRIKKPIQRDIIAGSVVFIVLVCVILSMQAYFVLSKVLSSRYEEIFEDVLLCADHMIDTDDLQVCIRTGTPSEKYEELQKHFDHMVDDFKLEHLYCIRASNTTITNVVSALSKEERAAGEKHRGIGEIYGYFPNDELKRYSSFWKTDHISFFNEMTWEGIYFTGAMPVKNEDGKTIALICVDVSVTNISEMINSFITPVILVILILSLVFALLMIIWMRKQIIKPILGLEKAVSEFAEKSHRMRDISGLELKLPEIHRKNEVESLAAAIGKMASDMQDYVRDVLHAEVRAKSAEKEAQDMSALAFRDALTQVKSKAAYDMKMRELNNEILNGTARFGIVMMDLNHLKAINDSYGHKKGDAYIVGACRQLCSSFAHSPVYRIGGDEFVVVLEGEDYDNRDKCFRDLASKFASSRKDPEIPVWECYSAATGMSIYERMPHELAEDVFKRADAAMYDDKQHMKAAALAGTIVDRGLDLKGSR